jgi:carboxypeptidase T
MRNLTLLLAFFLSLSLAAGEKQLWRAVVPPLLLQGTPLPVTLLDVVSVREEGPLTEVFLWETAERIALLGDAAGEFFPVPYTNDGDDAYRTLDEIYDTLYAIAERIPDRAALYTIGRSIEGRDILALKFSAAPRENRPELPEAVIVGLHHAREWIAAEVPLRFAEFIADRIADNPRIAALVEAGELWFVPVLNPDGYLYSHTVERMWRENRREHPDGSFGVDLNRNYDATWLANGHYHGAAPFSEPETRALRDLIVTPEGDEPLIDNARGIITYHSFGQLILYPWAAYADPAPDAARFHATGRNMADLIHADSGVDYTVKQIYWLYNAPIFGECTEWFYGATGGPGFTIELRPLLPAEGGFALDPAAIEPSFRENLPAALYFIESVYAGSVDVVMDRDRNGIIDHLESPDAPTPDDSVPDEGAASSGGCALITR